jgi:hypothetical protein
VIGHDLVRAELERELPPATLLRGPASVGKWTLAQHLRTHHGVAMADTAMYPDGLSIDAVRRVVAFVATAPFGPYKLVMARLDATSEAALNALLKTLEEPPPLARFILTATGRVLATITSRCRVYPMGLLGDEQVRQVLLDLGLKPSVAARRALLGRGQVRQAMQAEDHEQAHTTVVTIARALAMHDRVLFDRAFTGFDDHARHLLHLWLAETATGQYRLFTAAETYGLGIDRRKLTGMIAALSQVEAARARLGVRAALEPFLAMA